MSLNAGDGGVAVAQITLGDRTPYLTFDIMDSNDKCTYCKQYLFISDTDPRIRNPKLRIRIRKANN
jgi:hypothetical protein